MCGICGIVGPAADAPSAVSRVRDMMALIAHRGPDGEGIESGRGFVFGHRRLAIIDIEGGRQPMRSPDGRYALTYNGEIYNHVELRRDLAERGERLRTASDTEVLLHTLITRGVDGLSALNGMYAFAFADEATGEWLLVRDPFGIKPLYYTQVRGGIAFASEIKALLSHPDARARSDWTALQQYLTFQFCLGDRTLFQGINKLEPGTWIRGRGADITARGTFWDLDWNIDTDHTDSYFRNHLRDLLQDSVRLQMRSDVPVGAYLSGGLDSSLVVSMAARHTAVPLPVFTGRFAEGPAYDETPYARLVAATAGANYREVVPDAESFVDLLPRLIYHLDEPVAGPGVFPQYMVSRLASEQGVKVVLGGQGGDEIFGGYARYIVGYLEQALKGAIFQTQEEGVHVVTLSSIIQNLPLLQQYTPMLSHFWKDGLFEPMDARYFRLIDRSPDLERLLSQEARASFSRAEIFEAFRSIFHHPGTQSYVNKMTHFDLKTLLPALLQVEDRVSMAVSMEARVPLLDTRIAESVSRMPPMVKFKGGQTKYIFRQAIADLLPDAILERKDKMGFPVPLTDWMRKGPVRDFVQDVLGSRRCRERGLFDPAGLDFVMNSDVAFGRQLWGVLCLELWHRQFIDL
ncbi:asparagine synthase (glutamine-hydrolyzing) [Azospirillum isscasi]|uniref:asparagine synthase (glutamine-hydrolyzing) n=1 Tax=Azospirillum isscasi TaxID=3053926 RepID=A0ABU0WM79_9PROT|nr:asparagine synthase (glutamine-hydrolyzing) [Azospirillum isscasi]MDQ2105345.1 asparagine synthase (glutamine-hydrolyzing) [Azospirillum isscasi]